MSTPEIDKLLFPELRINTSLLRKVLEKITSEPWTWEQRTWVHDRTAEDARDIADRYQVPVGECGTSYCLAGHVAALTGGVVDNSMVRVVRDGEENRLQPISAYAQEALGLTTMMADRLFASVNSLHDLWSLAADWTADTDDPIEIPPHVTR